MIELITSKDNRIVREIRQLGQKKYRDQSGKFLIEGQKLVSEAIHHGAEVSCVVCCEALMTCGSEDNLQDFDSYAAWLVGLGIPTYRVDSKLFHDLSDTKTPQGILAVSAKKEIKEDAFFKVGAEGNYIVLDRIQDPGNLGTILRTADAAGFSGVILIKGSGDIYSPKVVRATAGSIFRIPVLFIDTPEEAIALLREKKITILCTGPRAEKIYYDMPFVGDTAIVIGNEAKGASPVFMEQCDAKVNIPMSAAVESLNAAVCAGILMYETIRQKSGITAQKLK